MIERVQITWSNWDSSWSDHVTGNLRHKSLCILLGNHSVKKLEIVLEEKADPITVSHGAFRYAPYV